MNYKDLFTKLGLGQDAMNQLKADVELHNFQTPDNKLPAIDFTAEANAFPVSLTAMLGRAIAKERGRTHLDKKGKHPLTTEINAFNYGYGELSKVYAVVNTTPKTPAPSLE